MFEDLVTIIEGQEVIREKIKTLCHAYEVKLRVFSRKLNLLHSEKNWEQVIKNVEAMKREMMPEFSVFKNALLSLIQPLELYFKYLDHFDRLLQETIFFFGVFHFILGQGLAQPEDLIFYLDLPLNDPTKFHIPVETYLHALPSLVSELLRFALNRVAAGDFLRPVQVNEFIKEIHANLQLLNFRNDSLRRRVDGVKYDVKRIEEVVFNLSVRGLIKTN